MGGCINVHLDVSRNDTESRSYILRYVPCVDRVKTLYVTLCSLCCLSKELRCYVMFLVLSE